MKTPVAWEEVKNSCCLESNKKQPLSEGEKKAVLSKKTGIIWGEV